MKPLFAGLLAALATSAIAQDDSATPAPASDDSVAVAATQVPVSEDPAAAESEQPASQELSTVAVDSAAMAEEEPPAEKPGNRLVEEIVVTAQKREENIQDVPISVQAFSAAKLDAVGALNAQDLPRITPGMTVTQQVGYATTFLRGVGSDAFLLADPSVVTYIDGVYNPFALGQFSDFGDVERIEVLKGPQGTLFGRNAIGGAVNILTKKPSFSEPSASVQTLYGSYEASKTRLNASVPLLDDLAISLSAVYNNSESNVKGRSAGEPLPRNVGRAARLKVFYAPTDWLDLQLSGLRSEETGAGTIYSPNTEPSTLGRLVGIQPQDGYHGSVNEKVYNHIDNKTVSGQVVVRTGWFDVKAIASDQYITVFQPYDVDGSDQPLVALVADPGVSDAQTGELQILSNGDSWGSDWLQWIVGGYFFQSRQGFDPAFARVATSDLQNGLLLGFPIPDLIQERILDNLDGLPIPNGTINIVGMIGTRSMAGFGQATINFSDAVGVTVGGRYSNEKRWIIESSSGIRNFDGSVTPIQDYRYTEDASLGDTTKSFDPKVSLNFRPTWTWLGQDPLIFASWQTATKSSTFNVLNIYDGPEYVKPEDIVGYEIGYKGLLFDGLASISAAAFRYEVKHQQVQLVSLLAGGAVQFENAGSSRSVGFDIDGVVQVFPNWIDDLVLSAGVAVLDAKYTSYRSGSGFDPATGLLTSNNDYTGNQTVRSPDISGNATLVKTFHVANSALEVGLDYYYNSGFYYLAQGTPNVEENEYQTLGARISWLYEPWNVRLTFFGQNLNNAHYNYGRFPIDFGTNDARAPKANYGMRLNWEY